ERRLFRVPASVPRVPERRPRAAHRARAAHEAGARRRAQRVRPRGLLDGNGHLPRVHDAQRDVAVRRGAVEGVDRLTVPMPDLMAELYPLCRSITGDGVRETLRLIGKRIPLEVHEVATGTQVFD